MLPSRGITLPRGAGQGRGPQRTREVLWPCVCWGGCSDSESHVC